MPDPRPSRVLVTRSPHQASELADRLRALGVEPVLIPAVEIAGPSSYSALDEALAHLERFHWLIFTSANAVEAFHRRLVHHPAPVIPSAARSNDLAESKDLPDNPHPTRPTASSATDPGREQQIPRIAAIGRSTARAIEAIGLTPDLIPPQAVAESLTEALIPHARQPDGSPTRFLLIRAEEAREYLPQTLRSAGANVTIAPAYRTVVAEGSVPAVRALFDKPANSPDAITFTSSSSVRNLLTLCEAANVTLPPGALRISIGPVTSQTLREHGYPPHAEASQATVAALAEAVLAALNARSA